MKALLLDACCECVDLRIGCLIIGYLELAYKIALIAFLLMGLTGNGTAISGVNNNDNATMNKSGLPRDLPSNDTKAQVMGVTLVFISVTSLLALVIGLSFSVVMLVGVHRAKRGLVKAYLIYMIVLMVLAVVMFYVSLSTIKYDTGSVVACYISFAVNLYFVLVIRSYYYRMKAGRDIPDTALSSHDGLAMNY